MEQSHMPFSQGTKDVREPSQDQQNQLAYLLLTT